jgi:Tfp pilus assembly protein PilF
MKTINSVLIGLVASVALTLSACGETPQSSIEDAQEAFENREYRIARAHLADIFTNGEATDEVYRLQMRLMLELGEGYAAMAAIEKLSDTALTQDDRRIATAHALLLQGKPETALELYGDVEPTDFSSEDFRMTLWALGQIGQEEEFAAGMDEALQRFPDNVHLNAMAAEHLIDLDNADDAEEYAQVALKNDPENFQALVANGRLDIVQGKLDQALVHYLRASEIYPHHVTPWAAASGLQLDLGQVEQAGETLRVALANHASDPFLQWQKSRHALMTNDMIAARTALEAARRAFRDNDEFTLFSAQVEDKAGNRELALAEYKRYLRAVGSDQQVEARVMALEN